MGRERYDEYRSVLGEISELVEQEGVELVLAAGDIFDTYTPSAEAEEIFYSGIKQIAKNCTVLIISGNHDDYQRLSAASSLAQECGIYIVGNALSPIKCEKIGKVYPKSSGEGWVIFENERSECVYVNAMPYPNEARFKEGRSDESFLEKMERWIKRGESGKEKDIPSIFLSHIFVVGGQVSDGEREIDLGGTRAVPLELLPKCDYVALGHLHKSQKLGENVYYSGATMRFSFDESNAERSVNVFSLTQSGLTDFKQIQLKSIKNLIRLQSNSVIESLTLLDKYPDSFVELTLNLDEPMTPSENSALRGKSNLVSLKFNVKQLSPEKERVSYKDKSSSKLFGDFYKTRFNAEAPERLLSLFLSLTEEE